MGLATARVTSGHDRPVPTTYDDGHGALDVAMPSQTSAATTLSTANAVSGLACSPSRATEGRWACPFPRHTVLASVAALLILMADDLVGVTERTSGLMTGWGGALRPWAGAGCAGEAADPAAWRRSRRVPRSDPWGVERGASDPFGTPSSMTCFGEREPGTPPGAWSTCVFRNLYLSPGGGPPVFLAPDGAGAADGAFVPPELLVGVPKFSKNPWVRVAPRVIRRSEFDQQRAAAWGPAGGGVIGTPALIYDRLNPKNVYHHLWDDMATVFTLAREAFPDRFPAAPGTPGDVTLVFTDAHGQTGPNDAEWEAVSEYPFQEWTEFSRPQEDFIMLRALAVGGRGRCTHRRHCTVDLRADEVRAFKAHMLAFYRIVSVLPPTPTAILIAREGRRLLTNINDLADSVRRLGYDTRIVGPFTGVPLRDQLRAIANASLAVFLHGAELGNAWMGLPDGACASVIFPFAFTDTIAWWVARKVGLDIAPFHDMALSRDDPRLATPVTHYEQALTLYNHDVTVPMWSWEQSLWCALRPGFDDPPVDRPWDAPPPGTGCGS
jgi:hypothetical protein